MRYHSSLNLAIQIFISLSVAFFFQGCNKKPKLTGANEKFVTSGFADDGDDTNGPGQHYVDPARSITEGSAEAKSDPKSYKSLNGKVLAATGNAPVRTSKANSTNKVTSTFVVKKTSTLQFILSSSASVSLSTGIGGYRAVARILDTANNYVTGTDYQVRYDFNVNRNDNTKIDVSQGGTQFTRIDNGKTISPTDTGPSNAFKLKPGKYTLLFELNIDAEADTKAEIKVSASVVFK
jgi:hypothetical protein